MPVADIKDSPMSLDEGVRLSDTGVTLGGGPDDPSVSGVVANIGDYWYQNNGNIWRKTGVLDTDWTQQSGGGGLNASQHRILDQLVHNLAENSYTEIVRTSGNLVSSITVYTDSGKTLKIREYQFTRTGNKITQVVTVQYDSSGLVAETYTETITRFNDRVSSISGGLI